MMLRKSRTVALISCLMALGAVVTAAGAESPWSKYEQENNGGEFRIEEATPTSFRFRGKRTAVNPQKAWALAITNVDREMWTQNKLVFSVRGLNSRPVSFGITLSYVSGGKVVMKSAASMTVAGTAWRDCVLGLDTDFSLGDTGLMFKQIKFGLNILDWKVGEEGGVEVRNVKMCAPSEIGVNTGQSDEFFAIPAREPVKAVPAANALKIYFRFDNEDLTPVLNQRTGGRALPQFGGFREMLLEALDGQAVLAETPETADLIVYSVCRPDPEQAKRIVAAVAEKGIPLVAAAEVGDPEIRAILPCDISMESLPDLPQRAPLRFTAAGGELAKLGGYNEAAFGIYRSIAAKAGSTVLAEFADGTPLLVEGRHGRGRVFYNMLAVGASVVPGKRAMDAFLVRLAGWICGRQLPEAPEPPVVPDGDGWYRGASDNNFGRFGWEIGSGLIIENLGRQLNVGKGICEYEFSLERKRKIVMPDWQFEGVDGKQSKIVWNTVWSDIGKVKLDSDVKIPAAWRGRKIYFHVLKGIDDTAAIFVNGRKIGEVTEETPHYWEVPHRHEIPAELIRFDDVNHIHIDSVNLRGNGSFGSCPELVMDEPGKEITFAADNISHLGMGGVIRVNGQMMGRMDASLAYPGIRWQIGVPDINLSLYNILGYAAVPQADGVHVYDLSKLNELPLADWQAPWVLLFTGNDNDSPLMVVFEHRQKRIGINHNGDSMNGLEIIGNGQPVGAIIPTWLYGSETQDTTAWLQEIPRETLNRINLWYPRALNYPVACTEDFRLNQAAGRIDIRDRFDYLKTDDDWHTPLRDYAPVPPLAYYSYDFLTPAERAAGKLLFVGEDGIVDRQLATNFGPYADKDGTNTVHWSLPLPTPDLSLLPHTLGFPKYEQIANDHFVNGVRFDHGGGSLMINNNKRFPREGVPAVLNLSMYGCIMGLCRCSPNPFIYSPENRRLMRHRMLIRMLEPLETHQYKMVAQWRQEPASGIRYTIYMNSPRDIVTRFRPETYGSSLVYGDSNETVRMIFTCLEKLADQMGQYDVVRANWDAIKRQVALYPLVLDDWGYLASGCLEYGGSCSIDMLNNEYSSLCTLARLAEIAGDEPMRQQALYRAARRMVPTLTRLRIKDYYVAHGMLPNPDNWSISTGFGEGGAGFRRRGANVQDVELFDMSQGIPQDLLALYRWFGYKELNDNYLEDVRKCHEAQGMTYIMASMLALGSDLPDSELMDILEECSTYEKLNTRLKRDWPGMDTGSYLEFILYRLKGNPVIADCRNMMLNDAVYDPDTQTLKIDYVPGASGARLVVKSTLKLLPTAGLTQTQDGSVVLPVAPGHRTMLQLRFAKP